MATSSPKRTSLPGSTRAQPRTAKAIGSTDPDERLEVTVMLRPREGAVTGSSRAESLLAMAARPPEARQYLTHESLAGDRGADAKDIAALEQFAHDNDLTVNEVNVAQRLVKLSGRLEDLARAFGAKLKRYRMGKAVFRGRTGSLSVPQGLENVIVGVFGFDTRPAARPHFRLAESLTRRGKAQPSAKKKRNAKRPAPATDAESATALAAMPLTAPQVAALYDFPKQLDGSGQTIALIELNTPNASGKLGTGYSTSSLKTYFKQLKLPMPKVSAVGVSGGANLPGINTDSDVEVMLDIEVAGAVAPGAQIAVYFAPNTSKGFIDVLSAAVHDTVRKPSVVSISWGGPEDQPFTTQQLLNGLEQILQDAAGLGITVCCAAGDDGSDDLPVDDGQGTSLRDGKPHVDFPASSPFSVACGGTTLGANGASIANEVVWNDGDPTSTSQVSGATGGGVSNVYPKPGYQSSVTVPTSPTGTSGRGVPDVAGDADPASGYLCKIAQSKQLVPIGGTSAVAPLWAGLIALINQRLKSLGKKPAGLINPILYQNAAAFHDITQGNNDIDGTLHKYAAAHGWDPCTGLGSPDGSKIMKALGG